MPSGAARSEASASGGRRRRRVGGGFTLIEVLIAIAIVLVLGGIVAVNFMGAREGSKVDIARIELEAMGDALDQFNLTFDRYPTEDEGLAALWSAESLEVEDESQRARWRSFTQRPKPDDPWGNAWNYRAESEYGAGYDLWSNGADGEEGTADDVTSWAGLDADGGDGLGGEPLPPSDLSP